MGLSIHHLVPLEQAEKSICRFLLSDCHASIESHAFFSLNSLHAFFP